MFVVVWKPRSGRGGGHQLALDKLKAERMFQRLCREMPDYQIKVIPADAAAAVMERQQQRRYRA
jgi:hypothetical protein